MEWGGRGIQKYYWGIGLEGPRRRITEHNRIACVWTEIRNGHVHKEGHKALPLN